MPLEDFPLVFVYGTLKRGLGNYRVMMEAGGEFICEGVTATRFPLVEQGLPFLLDRPGHGHQVQGEIFRVETPAGWRRLDCLEGHPNFYRRRLISIEGADGTLHDAWTYFVVRAEAKLATLPPLRSYGRDTAPCASR